MDIKKVESRKQKSRNSEANEAGPVNEDYFKKSIEEPKEIDSEAFKLEK